MGLNLNFWLINKPLEFIFSPRTKPSAKIEQWAKALAEKFPGEEAT